MPVSLIVAVSKNGVIGKQNSLPWYLPADLKRFKQLTTGHPIIMGRKTYESIGKPLPNRTNIVVTRDTEYRADGVFVVSSVDDALKLAFESVGGEEVFIIGGAEIFRRTIPTADKLYMTLIDATIDGDVLMPEIDLGEWLETSREKFPADDKNSYDYQFINYKRSPLHKPACPAGRAPANQRR